MATLEELAKQEGYKGFGTNGNAAFEKLAAESLAKDINAKQGTNYTAQQMATAIRQGNTAIPTLAGANPLVEGMGGKDLGINKDAITTPAPDPVAAYKAEAEKMKQARIATAVAGLQNRYNQTVSDINAKRQQLNPTYDAKRLGAQSSSQLQAKNFAEFLANRGLSRSGTSQQAEMMRNLQLQQTFNDLNKQQQDEVNYYQRMEDTAKQALNNDITMAQNEADTQYYNNFMNYMKEQDMLKNQQAFTRAENEASRELQRTQMKQDAYDREKTRMDNAIQNAFTNDVTKAGLTGVYNGQQTVDAKNNDLNKLIQLGQLTGSIDANQLIEQMSPNDIKYYESLGNIPGGFAAAINSATDPRQQKIIEAFRNRYLQANPNNPYYNTRSTNVMIPTIQGRITDSNLKTDELQRTVMNTENKMKQYQLDKIMPQEYEKIMNEVKGGRIDNAIKEIEQNNIDSKMKAEIKLILANAYQSTQAGNNAGSKSKSSEETLKKSPYYSEVYDSLSSSIEKYENDPKVMVKDKNGNIIRDWLRTPGSVQHKEVVNTIMQDPTLNEYEKYQMLNAFKIPIE